MPQEVQNVSLSLPTVSSGNVAELRDDKELLREAVELQREMVELRNQGDLR